MKKLIIMSALVMGGLGINAANAQLGIRINFHLNSHPVYAPPPPVEVVDEPVYDEDDYYYLPEVEAYYNVSAHTYYYNDGFRWISAAYLPGRYRDFDWRTARRYEIHSNLPYMRHDAYRGKFGGYRDRNDYYARAYPNRGREQYDNRGRGDQNRGGYDRGDERNQNNYSQGGYNRGGQDRNQGGYNQPSQPQNQGGYNRGGQDRNQGGYSQPSQPQNQGGQPSQGQDQQGGRGNGGQQGGRGNGGQQGQGNGNSQPANQGGGQKAGSYTGGEHYTANKMGVVQDRQDFGRPVRP